jgi:hypothetical protein
MGTSLPGLQKGAKTGENGTTISNAVAYDDFNEALNAKMRNEIDILSSIFKSMTRVTQRTSGRPLEEAKVQAARSSAISCSY